MAARSSASPPRLPRLLFLASRLGSAPTLSPDSPGHYEHGELPDWATAIGPATLIVIDEAGMADTLSLDAVVQFAIGRGASVRLIGDDQQLAAIGAGGVLRDIKNTHGALQLTELHRFTDPAEAHASLALREGDPGALGFYLDHGRVHVGDLAKITEDAFDAGFKIDRSDWTRSCSLRPASSSLSSTAEPVIIALTVGQIGQVRLGDGNRASVGDVIITRTTTADSDSQPPTGSRTATAGPLPASTGRVSSRSGTTAASSTVRLPADYVRDLDRSRLCHHHPCGPRRLRRHDAWPVDRAESRQQLYTLLTRGRHANHLYLQVVGDGDPHTLIRPDTISPRTPTETLQQILARDEAPLSASTVLRELNDPAARLFRAVQRYTDSLHVAGEQLLGPQTVAELDQADHYIPGLTAGSAWPTLRAHLITLAAETKTHPLRHLLTAVSGGDLQRTDMAAVLDWRLTALTPTEPGPLPWLPSIPATLQADPIWGAYLAKRSQLVADLADQIQDHLCRDAGEPAWVPPGSHPDTALIGEIAVWRAANGINPHDLRPIGEGGQLDTAAALWKQRLDRDIARSTDSSGNAGLTNDNQQTRH